MNIASTRIAEGAMRLSHCGAPAISRWSGPKAATPHDSFSSSFPTSSPSIMTSDPGWLRRNALPLTFAGIGATLGALAGQSGGTFSAVAGLAAAPVLGAAGVAAGAQLGAAAGDLATKKDRSYTNILAIIGGAAVGAIAGGATGFLSGGYLGAVAGSTGGLAGSVALGATYGAVGWAAGQKLDQYVI